MRQNADVNKKNLVYVKDLKGMRQQKAMILH